MSDAINPDHYKIANKIQLIELIRLMPFSMGNSIKYCYRNGNKENALQDLRKSLWYLNDYNSHVIGLNIDEDEIYHLSKIVFGGLPKWEKNICMMLTHYFVEVNGDDLEDEEKFILYKEVREVIEEKIKELE